MFRLGFIAAEKNEELATSFFPAQRRAGLRGLEGACDRQLPQPDGGKNTRSLRRVFFPTARRSPTGGAGKKRGACDEFFSQRSEPPEIYEELATSIFREAGGR